MKYYSEKLNKVFDTEQACLDAEFKAKEKENLEKIRKERETALAKEKKEKDLAERKALAAEVEDARKSMVAAQKAYQAKIKEFVDKYHSYHFTTTNTEEIPTLFDVFDRLFTF